LPALFDEPLDAQLRGRDDVLRVPYVCDPLLEEPQCFGELEVVALEAGDDCIQPGERLLQGEVLLVQAAPPFTSST
jgi:hypothetical protein